MSPHQLLGVSERADPLELLGLRPDRCEVGHVELALRSRLRELDERSTDSNADPDARPSDDVVEAARQLLRDAAATLKDPAQRAACLARAREKARMRAVQAQFKQFRTAQRSGRPSSSSDDPKASAKPTPPSATPPSDGPTRPVRPGSRSAPGDSSRTQSSNEPDAPHVADDVSPGSLLADADTSERGPASHDGRRRQYDRTTRRPQIQLTPFDRQVLAVLVAFGGWNNQARSRLTALATMYGVTASGLVKVVKGLSEFARAGGGHLDIADITGGASRMPTPAGAGGPELGGFIMPAWLDRLTPDLSEPTPRTTFRLALLFAVIATLVVIIVMRLALSGDAPSATDVADQAGNNTATTPADLRGRTIAGGQQNNQSAERTDGDPESARGPQPAQFPSPPTFSAPPHPEGAVDLADAADAWVAELESLARRIALAEDTADDQPGDGAPTDAVFRQWDAVIRDIGHSWVLIDPAMHSALLRAIDEVVYEAGGRPIVAERLLQSLRPHPARLTEPAEVWTDSWKIGTLSRIAETARGFSPAVTARARDMLTSLELTPIHNTLPGQRAAPNDERGSASIASDQTGDGFAGHARGWLLRMAIGNMPESLAYGDDVLPYWELWLAALDRLGPGPGREHVIARTIDHVLRSPPAIAVDDVRVKLLGRLLASADLLEHPHVLATVRRAFDDGQGVSTHALWILTSIMAQHDATPWFESRFVVGEQAGSAARFRRWDDINSAWEARMSTSRDESIVDQPVDVDADVLDRWRAALHDLSQRAPGRTEHEQIHMLVMTAMLHDAAAHMEVGEAAMADGVLDELAEMFGRAFERGDRPDGAPDNADDPVRELPPAPRAPQPTRGPVPPQRNPGVGVSGSASGADGQWRQRFLDAQRSSADQIEVIDSLRGETEGDLGPVDAATFVEAVYRATPLDVRFAAQQVLTSEFRFGVNVAQAMADLLDATAPSGEAGTRLAATIEDYTDYERANVTADLWIAEAKIALLDHALSLQPHPRDDIDAFADELQRRYIAQLATLQREPERVAAVGVATPGMAARRLTAHWRERAEQRSAVALNTATLETDATALARRAEVRRSLARHGVEQCVAERLAAMDWMAAVVAGDRPLRVAELEAILDRSSRTRRHARHVLDQAITVELTIAQLWSLRLGPLPEHVQSAVREGTAPTGPPPARDHMAPPDIPDRDGDEDHAALAERLNALRPQQPMAYFELAEEIADVARDDPSMEDLARQLFGLAGALDPDRFGRSAALALADMADDSTEKRRLLALASILHRDGQTLLWNQQPGPADPHAANLDPAAVMMFLEAMGQYRRGQGARALSTLRREGMEQLLNVYVTPLNMTADEIVDAVRTYRTGQNRPPITPDERDAMYRVEIAMLANPETGFDRPWSADLLFTQGRPLIEVDPDRLEMAFGIDLSRPYYRGDLSDGRWTASP